MSGRAWSLVFAATAVEQATEARAWWREHRHDAPHAFTEDLAKGLDRLRRRAFLGAVCRVGPPIVRRILLRRVGFHVYYTVEEATRTIVVRVIWHAARRQPRLEG